MTKPYFNLSIWTAFDKIKYERDETIYILRDSERRLHLIRGEVLPILGGEGSTEYIPGSAKEFHK